MKYGWQCSGRRGSLGFRGLRGLGVQGLGFFFFFFFFFIVHLLLEGEFMVKGFEGFWLEGQDFGPLSRLHFVCIGSPRVQDPALWTFTHSLGSAPTQ